MILIINIKLNYAMVICYVHFAESYRNDQQNEIKKPTLEIKAFRSLHHVVIFKGETSVVLVTKDSDHNRIT